MLPSMEFRHLRYFVAVAEELHFGRAAERLGIAQPPLSRQIHDLEVELGFALFERSRPRIALTGAGRVLYSHARSILTAVELGIREARCANLGERGRVRVGYPSSLAYSGLTELLGAFRSRFPRVEVALSELPPGQIVDALKSRELDVGFVRGPEKDASLEIEPVRREALLLAMPKNHPLATKKRVALGAVANEPFVFFPRYRGPKFYDSLIELCRHAGFEPRIVQEAPQVDVLSLVAAGFGMAIVPSSVREPARDDIVFCRIVGGPTTELFIAWRADDTSPSSREFVDVVRRLGVHRNRRAAREGRRAVAVRRADAR